MSLSQINNTIKESNDEFIFTLKKRIGDNITIYLNSLKFWGDEMYLSDGNANIWIEKNSYLNIFCFEDYYQGNQFEVNSLHFINTPEPCSFKDSSHLNYNHNDAVQINTIPFGLLENVILYYYKDINEFYAINSDNTMEEKAVVTKAIVFVFNTKFICFEADFKNTNRTNVFILPKNELSNFINEHQLFEL